MSPHSDPHPTDDWSCSGQGEIVEVDSDLGGQLDPEIDDWTCSAQGELSEEVVPRETTPEAPRSALSRCVWHFAPVRQSATHVHSEQRASDR